MRSKSTLIFYLFAAGMVTLTLVFVVLGLTTGGGQPLFLPAHRTHTKFATYLTFPASKADGGILVTYHDARDITFEENPTGNPDIQAVTFFTDKGVLMSYPAGPAPFITSWRPKPSDFLPVPTEPTK